MIINPYNYILLALTKDKYTIDFYSPNARIAPIPYPCYHPSMNTYPAQITEIRMAVEGQRQAVIACPPSAVPAPGQYLQAHQPEDQTAPLPVSLFLAGTLPEGGGFVCAPGAPENWRPGQKLSLRGPLGRGFSPPATTQRVAFAALGETVSRLAPLASQALDAGQEVALFTDAPLPDLPAQIEISPLAALPEALNWADYLALDAPAGKLSGLHQALGVRSGQPLPCPIQVLAYIDMPCGGLAECCICAVEGQSKKTLLACEDGPVFDFHSRGLKIQ